MLTYLLIIFIVMMALAPLAHFAPSKRQRRIAHMREYAALHGLYVEFRNLPGNGPASGASHRDMIYYGKRLPSAAAEGLTPCSWTRAEVQWRSVGGRTPVPEPLLDLPREIIAASIDYSSCGVYWVESGGEREVEQIQRALECWSAQLLS